MPLDQHGSTRDHRGSDRPAAYVDTQRSLPEFQRVYAAGYALIATGRAQPDTFDKFFCPAGLDSFTTEHMSGKTSVPARLDEVLKICIERHLRVV